MQVIIYVKQCEESTRISHFQNVLFLFPFTPPPIYSFNCFLSFLITTDPNAEQRQVPRIATPNTFTAPRWSTYWDVTSDKANGLGTSDRERFHELSGFKVICDNVKSNGRNAACSASPEIVYPASTVGLKHT
jgi:hypothetical protein